MVTSSDESRGLVRTAPLSAEQRGVVLGEIFAQLDRDAAAEAALVDLAPQLSDEEILWVWERLSRYDAIRWRARAALVREALRRVEGRAQRDGRVTAAVQQLAGMLAIEPRRVYRLAQIHDMVEAVGVGADTMEVLPEQSWYEEALAAPDPAVALGYAVEQVTSGRTYNTKDFRRDVQRVAAAKGRPLPDRPPVPQVRLRANRRDGSHWPSGDAVAFDLGDIAAIEVETPWGMAVLAIDGQGRIVADVQQGEE
jgi:hypothetical protein